jgi:hypothetical protein
MRRSSMREREFGESNDDLRDTARDGGGRPETFKSKRCVDGCVAPSAATSMIRQARRGPVTRQELRSSPRSVIRRVG